MIFDVQTLLSNQQAITATAASTNQIDLGPVASGMVRDIGPGEQIPLLIQVTTKFVSAATDGTLTVALQVDSDPAFGTAVTVWQSGAIPEASLLPGYVVVPEYVTRRTNKRYLRLNYTVAGSGNFTGGAVTAGVTMGNQTNG